jgi:hypothetical protein
MLHLSAIISFVVSSPTRTENLFSATWYFILQPLDDAAFFWESTNRTVATDIAAVLSAFPLYLPTLFISSPSAPTIDFVHLRTLLHCLPTASWTSCSLPPSSLHHLYSVLPAPDKAAACCF